MNLTIVVKLNLLSDFSTFSNNWNGVATNRERIPGNLKFNKLKYLVNFLTDIAYIERIYLFDQKSTVTEAVPDESISLLIRCSILLSSRGSRTQNDPEWGSNIGMRYGP